MDWESLVWNTDLAWARKFVILAIARKANTSGLANVSAIQIAALTGLARRTVHEQIALAITHGYLQRIAPSLFQIRLTQPDSVNGVARTSAYLSAALPAHEVTKAPHGISGPYKERTSEGPFGTPLLRVQGSMSSSEVQENEELGQEGISITREGQGELISTDVPAWLTDLRTTPGYDLDAAHEQRLIQRVTKAVISTQRLCETATALAAKWESYRWSPSNKRGYKRIDLTFFDWAKRGGFNGNGKSQGRVSAIEAGRAGAFADSARYERLAEEQRLRSLQ